MKKLTILFLMLVCIFPAIAQNVHISGTFINRKYSDEIVVMYAYSQKMITSVPINADNSFTVDITLDKAAYIYVGPDQYNVVLLIASPGETIKLVADIDDITHPIITGSLLTGKLYTMMDMNDAYTAKTDSVYAVADSETLKIEQQRKQYFRDIFLKEEPTLASLVFLDMLNPVEDSALFRDVVEKLNQEFPENEFVKDYMDELKNTVVTLQAGSTPPEIILNDPNDQPLALSSLKGKIVLVDFWASWCKPCLEEIPNLVELYKKYHKKGFEIYSVSLDRDKKSWTDAIDKYNLEWHHVSDLEMWASKAAIDWGVESIPATFLLDKNGVILAKNLRGEKLREMLESLYE